MTASGGGQFRPMSCDADISDAGKLPENTKFSNSRGTRHSNPYPRLGGSCRQAGKKFRTLKFSESFDQRYQILAFRLDTKTQKYENLT